jgi:hypothetical protein
MVKEPVALQAFADRNYPSGFRGAGLDLPVRARAVAEVRDSKRGKGRCPATVLLRGFHGCMLDADGASLAVAAWTARAGVAAVGLDRVVNFRFSGNLAVVENLEVFWNIEKVSLEVDLALYAEGRLDGKLLAWLASTVMQSVRVLHFGDYDPVGLDEYLRIKRACPGRTKLYRPDNLDELFRKYGKPRLLTDSAAVMNRLRRSEDPEVRSVVTLLDRYGAGLEQEALLIQR